MNENPSRTLWISLGSALFAIFLLYSYSQEKKAEYDQRYGTLKQVVVASSDINEMQTIDDTMVETISRPVDFIEPSAIENPEDAVGKVAAAPIRKGEQIQATKILSPGPNTGLSLQVAPNKRAVTIPVDDIRGVAKLIRPGDRVDILSALELPGKQKSVSVKTLLQDVVVLATGVRITNNLPRVFEFNNSKEAAIRNLSADTSFSNITIELSPKEAQDIIYMLASNPGSIYMILRNPNDRVKKNLAPTSVSSFSLGRQNFSVSRVPASPAPRRAAPTPRPKPATPPRAVARPQRPRKNSNGWVDIK